MERHSVLIPLDETAFSRRIFPTVRTLFAPEDCRIVLVSVEDPPPDDTNVGRPTAPTVLPGPYGPTTVVRPVETRIPYGRVEESRLRARESQLEADAHALRDAGYSVTTVAKLGQPTDGILQAIDEHDVDLVAMTTHGRTGVSELIFDSVAESVLTRTEVPVMMLHPKESDADTAT